MAFLIASPWNSFSITLILIGLIGWKWTALFIAASVVAFLSGWIFDWLERRSFVPKNPYREAFESKMSQSPLFRSSLNLSSAALLDG